MSRIGKKPVPLPNGVTVMVSGSVVKVKGGKGELELPLPAGVTVVVNGSHVDVSMLSTDDKQAKASFGTTRAHLANMVKGVSDGFQKDLEIQGTGYKAALQGSKLTLNLGYSHPIEYIVPAAVKVVVADAVRISVSGVDKQLVGEVAARIRAFCPPEPYKGKGVRYKDEHVRRKAGKTVA